VKPAVEWIFIFRSARRTHLKISHRRPRSVVWNVLDYGKSGPTVCAVDKWVSVTTINRIEQLSDAVAARRNVGGDRQKFPAVRFARQDPKITKRHGL